jgi:hypothetical protein
MVRGGKRKNPRYEETRSLSQWLDDCPRTNSMEVVVVKQKNPTM